MGKQNNMTNVLDLFCGCGGLSHGFHSDSFYHIIGANDIMEDACSSYSLNNPNTNVRNMPISEFIDNHIDGISADVVLGGPPCQSFSTAGKRLLDDPRAGLFREYHRAISILKPKIFIFENVKGILSIQGGELFKRIQDIFSQSGYAVTHRLINMADYGVPQTRERVILVGTLGDKDFVFPEPTHGPGITPRVTLDDAIGDLPELTNGGSATTYTKDPYTSYQDTMRNGSSVLRYHTSANSGDRMLELIKHIPEGGSRKSAPLHLQPKSCFGNSYSRLRGDRPGVTITRNLGTPSSSRCIHPTQDRALSSREGARIQSFPDTYMFHGGKTSINLQIGNAVPPIISQHLSQSVKQYLT